MKKWLSLILVLAMVFSLASCDLFSPLDVYLAEEKIKLRVHFIDVGQGDSILLESAGEFVLVDAGEKEYGERVLDYIDNRYAKSLKYMVATHPHSDHYGGLRTVLGGIDVENFITAETDQRTDSWLNLLKAVDKYDVNYIDAVPGESYTFGKARFTILAPLGTGYEGYNNYSVVMMVECGDIRFLLTGDAEKESEKEMLNAGLDLRADVLKCGHHGSSTSSTAAFLKAVSPSYAIISCGKDNDYGHPHRETLKKLTIMECTMLRTDTKGTIVAATDGKRLSFTTKKGLKEIPTYDADSATKNSGNALDYVGNKSSGVFHYANCPGAETMNEKNRVEFSTRQEAIKAGYTPCSLCKP